MTKKFNLSKSTAINSLKESIKILENRDYSKARKNVFFERLQKNTKETDIYPNLISSDKLTPEILDSFSKKVIENTKKLDNHKNTIRLIDGNNNLIVFKGDISQPFKSIDDITCQLFVNHKFANKYFLDLGYFFSYEYLNIFYVKRVLHFYALKMVELFMIILYLCNSLEKRYRSCGKIALFENKKLNLIFLPSYN